MENIKIINYRNKFKKHYNIDFSNNYVVHHIDLNRENNDIKNLMLLPVELHTQYHYYLNATLPMRKGGSKTERTIEFRIRDHFVIANSEELELIRRLIDTIYQCSKWMDYKHYLDGLMPNIHGIQLDQEK